MRRLDLRRANTTPVVPTEAGCANVRGTGRRLMKLLVATLLFSTVVAAGLNGNTQPIAANAPQIAPKTTFRALLISGDPAKRYEHDVEHLEDALSLGGINNPVDGGKVWLSTNITKLPDTSKGDVEAAVKQLKELKPPMTADDLTLIFITDHGNKRPEDTNGDEQAGDAAIANLTDKNGAKDCASATNVPPSPV